MRRAMMSRREIIHIGPVGDQPGGMAQVISALVDMSSPDVFARAIPSLRYARDPLQGYLTFRAVMQLMMARRGGTSGMAVCVHVSDGGSLVREGAIIRICKTLGYTCHAYLHGAEFPKFADRHPDLVRMALCRCDGIFALTSDTERSVRGCGVWVPICRVVNPVRVPEAHTNDEKTIIFGGELSVRKGIDVLLEAWPAVHKRCPDWRLLLVGPEVASYHLPSSIAGVVRTGTLPNARLRAALCRSQIAVLPSRAEALPMVLLEAMACGNAVVGTDVGSVGRLLEGGAGVMVDPLSAGALASSLVELCTDDVARSRYARAALDRIQDRYGEESSSRIIEQVMFRGAH